MAALRRLPLQDILADQKGKPFDETPAPMVDGMVMTEQPAQAFAQGNIAPAAYLAGSNSNEASLLPATGLSTAAVLERAGADLPKLRKLYETHGVFGDNALADALFDDRAFAAGAQGLALYAARLGHAAFVYYFTYVPQNLRHQVHGVAHGYEIPFVFGNAGYGRYPKLAARIARNTTAQDRQLRKMVQRYWTNFAKTGDPNAEGLPQWPATRPGDHATLVIGVHTHAVHGFHRARLAAAFAAFTAQSHLNLPH